MDLDIHKTFGELYRSDEVAKILQELQQYLKTRDESREWARNLRFLAPMAGVPARHDPDEDHDSASMSDECVCGGRIAFHNAPSQDTLEVTGALDFPDCRHYVAVSWTWPSDQDAHAAVGAPANYVVKTGDGPRGCKVPRNILSRASSYAAHYNLPFIWFDRECIVQEHPIEQWLGIQSMDIVYQRSSHPLGILQTVITTQAHLDLFAQLVDGIDIPSQDLPALLELLQLLEQDQWFTRAWTLQESTSAGLEMHLLIPHEPWLQKPEVLGAIEGEIEISIFEYLTAMSFAHACTSESDDVIHVELRARLYGTIDRLLSFVPLSIEDHEGEFNESDYRQVCNAAQALTYLKPRMNQHVSDRLAIMGNMCNYNLRFDTNEIVSRGYGFSICAFALAIFNGDLSLTSFTNAVDGEYLAYSWGPQRNLSLSELRFIEEDSDLVRASPANLLENGLLLKGWLWRVHTFLAVDPSISQGQSGPEQDDPPALIWGLLKQLVREKLFLAAQVLWRFTRRTELGERESGDWVEIPANVDGIFNLDTGRFVYHDDKWVRSEADFRILFKHTAPNNDPTATQHREAVRQQWRSNEWLWAMVLRGRVPLGGRAPSARLCQPDAACSPSAIFDVQESSDGGTRYVFLPSTILDAPLARNPRANDAIFWVVKLDERTENETGCMVIRGTGEMCRGWFETVEAESPEMFIFS